MKAKKKIIKELTRTEVLTRLREVWEMLKPGKEELTQAQMESVQYNIKLAEVFNDLQGAKDFSPVHAIGFAVDDGDDEDEYDDEE